MAKRDERIKASDVFSPFLGKTSVFEEAFTEIESLAVESRELSHRATRKHTRHFDQNEFWGIYRLQCSFVRQRRRFGRVYSSGNGDDEADYA